MGKKKNQKKLRLCSRKIENKLQDQVKMSVFWQMVHRKYKHACFFYFFIFIFFTQSHPATPLRLRSNNNSLFSSTTNKLFSLTPNDVIPFSFVSVFHHKVLNEVILIDDQVFVFLHQLDAVFFFFFCTSCHFFFKKKFVCKWAGSCLVSLWFRWLINSSCNRWQWEGSSRHCECRLGCWSK